MTTDELLAKLRKLDTAASPGPWQDTGDRELRDARAAFLAAFWQPTDTTERRQRANCRLASLAHEVRPLAEALELGLKAAEHFQACGNCGERKYGERWCEIGRGLLWEAFYNQRVALAQLAERVKEGEEKP